MLRGTAYDEARRKLMKFQWAPTLGGECYKYGSWSSGSKNPRFNGHPPLGVNATRRQRRQSVRPTPGFKGHPPLGVNATLGESTVYRPTSRWQFQWAPTLGGECYSVQPTNLWKSWCGFNGHPPLGVNAT